MTTAASLAKACLAHSARTTGKRSDCGMSASAQTGGQALVECLLRPRPSQVASEDQVQLALVVVRAHPRGCALPLRPGGQALLSLQPTLATQCLDHRARERHGAALVGLGVVEQVATVVAHNVRASSPVASANTQVSGLG